MVENILRVTHLMMMVNEKANEVNVQICVCELYELVCAFCFEK